MQISAVDQLIVVSDGDSYASAMGVVYPTGGGNAQYYEEDNNGVITKVQPEFADAAGSRLGYYPLLFSALEGKYMQPQDSDYFEFRINNATSDAAIIAKGTLAQFRAGTAVQSGTWSTAADGKAQTNAQVFKTSTVVITNGTSTTADDSEFPVLYFIGQPAYGHKFDIDIYCTSKVNDIEMLSKGSLEIRSMATENYKVIIEARSNKESNANDQVINFHDETITLTATLLKNGSSTGVTGQTYNWHKFGESGITMQDGTQYTGRRDQQSLDVGESMVNGVSEFVCDVTLAGSVYTNSITIHDIQDQYIIDKGRKTYDKNNNEVENTGIIKSTYKVIYTPTVTDKTTGTSSSTGWSFGYVLKNAAGTSVRSASGASLTVQGSEVLSAGGMTVIITGTNSSM